jgi:anti-sigma factor RsiW
MSCHEALDGYVDGELDPVRTVEFEGHLQQCGRCRALRDQCRELRQAVKAHSPYFDAPQGLQKRICGQLAMRVAGGAGSIIQRPFAPGWRLVAVAAGILGLVISSAMFVQILRRPSPTEMLAQEVVSSHIRSLMGSHLTDVPSSDQHTVKPWFSGKLDFAPVFKDLAPEGFPLTGGRLDYLDGRPVAALIYKRHQHIINLFLWPSSKSDSRPQTLTIRGYGIVHWAQSGMTYWAVSDLNARELTDFVTMGNNNVF